MPGGSTKKKAARTASRATGDELAISATEAARRIGMSRSGIYKAIRAGTVPSVRVGHRVLVPVKALEEMLAGDREEAS